MRTREITVTSKGAGMPEALAATEALAIDGGLSHKETLRLRLLAEELFGMIGSIVGEAEGVYWVEQEGRSYAIHLKSDVSMTQETRKQLIELSSQGENAAARGFMGRLRDMIGTALLPADDSPSLLSLGLISMGSPGGFRAGSMDWSMSLYKQSLEGQEDADARDELEKSIVASIADEVTVSIRGFTVETVIMKAF